jgi:N-acetylglucosaminyldiphosphoundecaprenol N-acetyl-beta-D-mannosaminyltransferase
LEVKHQGERVTPQMNPSRLQVSRPDDPHRILSNRITISGIPVDNLTEDEAVAAIDGMIAAGGTHYGAVINAAKVVAADRDEQLKRTLIEADLITADGMSVIWASRVLGVRLKERVTGIDLFQRLVRHAAQRGLSVYFLGARESSVRGTVEFFSTRYPSLRIAGWRDGYFKTAEDQSVSKSIKDSGADLLFVAFGSPKQEYWIASNVEQTGVGFALGVGGSFDHLSGFARRAPMWMQRAGLEWFHRLMQEPRRLWRRYLIGNASFVGLILRQRTGRGQEATERRGDGETG